MSYADYAFYKDRYAHKEEAGLDAASFDFYSRKATQEIKRYTFGNIDEGNIPGCVKLCCCEIAERLYEFDKLNQHSGLVSEKVGDLSESYESGDTLKKVLSNEIRDVIYLWLANTELLYRGVR